MNPTPHAADPVDEIVGQAGARLRRDRRVRRRLPGEGKLFIDGRTPFLALHRPPPEGADPGTVQLVTSLRSYLLGSGERPDVTRKVVEGVSNHMVETLGGALVLEVWAASPPNADDPTRVRVHAAREDDLTTRDFERALTELSLLPPSEVPPGEDRARVDTVVVADPDAPAPPGRPSVFDAPPGDARTWIGLEMPPVHFDPDSGRLYPERLHRLRRELARALERALHAWASRCTRLDVEHPHALGRRTLGRSGRAIDARLANVAEAFDLILGISPVNVDEAWAEFSSGGHEGTPRFRYRPLAFDPEALKRSLFHVPVERIEDPLAADLIREKQDELDLRISMLRNRGRAAFLQGSLALWGRPDADLLRLARRTLELEPQASRDRSSCVTAGGFVDLARAELDRLAGRHPDFPRRIELRDDLASGLLVSRGVLCVSRDLQVTPERAHALIQHEVGTHVLTYFNGSRQDMRLLRTGLSGYGTLQEGLAVLAEHLMGGLTRSRARTLAARVVAVDALVRGADFTETWRLLSDEHGLGARAAFGVTARVHRGGGCTKDIQYLEGLRDLLQYLRSGRDVETLFVGKVGLSHIDIVHELTQRGVIRKPALLPLYLEDEAALRRLEDCRSRTALDLFQEAGP